jgi:hypothetical protein
MTTAAIAAYESGCSMGKCPTKKATEELMRIKIVLISLGALAIGSFVHPATAAKTKMGCEIGKEIWDAQVGKCMAGKYVKKSAKKSAKKTDKK